MRRSRMLSPAWLCCTAVLVAGTACAHPLAPSLLELREQEDGRAIVRWRTPLQRAPGSELSPALPPQCRTAGEVVTVAVGTALESTWAVDCGSGVVGLRVGARGIAASGADVVLRVVRSDGSSLQTVLTAESPAHVVPARPALLDVIRSYGRLGLEHIASGWDHLLFVLALVLLVPSHAALVKTVTAFTVGHSVTLSLAAAGWLGVPQALAEVCIAGSLLVLACELPRERPSLLRRHPWPVAAMFGLLHGLGFAGALAEAGLPGSDIVPALLSFNLGIEAGQLVVVVVTLAVRELCANVAWTWPPALRLAPVYAIGSCSAFWVIERSAAAAATWLG